MYCTVHYYMKRTSEPKNMMPNTRPYDKYDKAYDIVYLFTIGILFYYVKKGV